jgi:hypothetical protein
VKELGRPNVYTDIVRDLGGVATASQIYAYGSRNGRITGTYESCKAALAINIRNGKLIGRVSGEMMVAPRGMTQTKAKSDFRPTQEDSFTTVLNRLNTQGSFAVALEARMDSQFAELFGRVDAIERRLNDLEMKQRLNLPF